MTVHIAVAVQYSTYVSKDSLSSRSEYQAVANQKQLDLLSGLGENLSVF